MAAEPLVVSLATLRKVFAVLTNYLEESKGADLVIDRDYFWSIGPGELFEIYEKPGELGIGQLTESLERLNKVLSGEDDPLPYHLVWLSDVLRALGTLNSPG